MCMVKAKFRYAIQVADLAFDKFVRVCDQLQLRFFGGQKQVADRFELSRQAAVPRLGLPLRAGQ